MPNIKDVLSISAWKCTCKVGKRKVGCCSDIASLIFYLSCGKYEEKLKKPGYSLNSIFLKMGLPVESDDGEDDDDFENSIIFSGKNQAKNKRKMSTSSSLETIMIKTKTQDSLITKLVDILPEWGGNINISDVDMIHLNKYNHHKIIDTCTIDYFMLAISFSCLLNDNLIQLLNNSKENKI